MTFEDVKRHLRDIGVPQSSYNIDGEGTVITPGTVIMEKGADTFFVYMEERNEMYNQRLIRHEGEAVEYFLQLLERNSRTYKKYLESTLK